MPFEIISIKNNDSDIYLMRYNDFEPSDHLDKLTESELERFASFKGSKRKQEFVATRILRHKLFGFEHIHYDAQGAPFIEQEGYISISHSKDLIGIALNKKYKIGLDLESFRSNIQLVAEKFLSASEKLDFNIKDSAVLCKIWSSKEALYKLAGRNQIHFKTELNIKKNESDDWIGYIDNHDHVLKVNLDIFEYEGTFVTINSKEIITEQHYDIGSNS